MTVVHNGYLFWMLLHTYRALVDQSQFFILPPTAFDKTNIYYDSLLEPGARHVHWVGSNDRESAILAQKWGLSLAHCARALTGSPNLTRADNSHKKRVGMEERE